MPCWEPRWLGLAHGGGQSRLPLLGLLLAVLPWPLFSVSSTALAVRLSPLGEGLGLGLFTAATGLAAVSGALLGGWLAARWGYTAASGAAVVGLALGLGLTLCIRPVQGA